MLRIHPSGSIHQSEKAINDVFLIRRPINQNQEMKTNNTREKNEFLLNTLILLYYFLIYKLLAIN
jgi:hypothetical protein